MAVGLMASLTDDHAVSLLLASAQDDIKHTRQLRCRTAPCFHTSGAGNRPVRRSKLDGGRNLQSERCFPAQCLLTLTAVQSVDSNPMTTPFAFLPRAVLKHTKEWPGISRPPPSPSSSPSPPPDPSKGKEKAVEPKQSTTQDIASLVPLALSDYNIWLDPDLRSKLEACLQDDADDAGCTSPPPTRPPSMTSLRSQSYPSTTSSAGPRFAVRSHKHSASPTHPKPRWSKPSARTRVTPSKYGCVSPLPHRPRPSGMALERPPGRKTWVGTKYAGGTGPRCVIVCRVGGRVPDGTT